MANYINDTVFDNGLSTLQSNANTILITSTDPNGVYATATANQLGSDTVSPNAISSGATDGRRVVIPAITSGSITNTGTATHWALTTTAGTLYANGSLTASQAVTSGNTFTLDAVSITIRDAT